MNRNGGLWGLYNTIINKSYEIGVGRGHLRGEVLVDFVDEWSGMKCSAIVVCGGVDLFATAVGKVDRAKLRRESME